MYTFIIYITFHCSLNFFFLLKMIYSDTTFFWSQGDFLKEKELVKI